MKRTYKGIEFAEGYNKSFDEFKKEIGSTHVFNDVPEEDREKEIKKAYEIATDGNINSASRTSEKTQSK